MVQRELARRTKGKNRHSGVHLLSGRIKCGNCGGWYGSKVWHSPEKCKRTVWQCNQKYKNEVRCTTPYLDEASVKERFTVAVNQLLAGRDAAIVAYEQANGVSKTTFENGVTVYVNYTDAAVVTPLGSVESMDFIYG